MDSNVILSYLNNETKPEEYERTILNKWRNLYFGMSLHTSGAAPAFQDLSNNGLTVPVNINTTSNYGNGYPNYLSALQSIGFDYNGYWIFPPNFQGWEYHFIFDKIIFSRHPREPEEIRQWRFSQYVPITQSPCGQLNEVVTGAIFQDSNFTIEIDDKKDNDYINGNNFSGFDLVGYIANIGYKNMIEDANGYFLRIPKYPNYAQPEGKPVEVDIWFVNSKDIKLFSDEFIIFEKNGYGWFIDKNTIWRYTWDRESKRYFLASDDAQGYYATMLNRLPVSKAGGIWNTHGYYESYYYKAKPLMDDILRSYSAAQLVDKEASHPYIVETDVECPECNGQGLITATCEECPGGTKPIQCGECHGSGTISRNPGQHVVMPKKDFIDGAGVKFVNPDVTINKNLRETVREVMDMILEALHLNKQKTDTVQSGLAKAIDQERLYKFINTICNDLFDKIIPDTLDDIIAYRNVRANGSVIEPDNKPYKIVKPTQFQIKTAEDLLVEYETATKANIPKFILQRIALDYIDKQYSGDAVLKRKGAYIICYDALSVYSTGDKKQVGTPEQQAYSLMISTWLDEVINDKGNDWFINASDEDITREVDKLEDAYFEENPVSDEPGSDNSDEIRTYEN